MTALALEPLKERAKGVALRRSAQNPADAYARAKNRVACHVERRQPLPRLERRHDLDSAASLLVPPIMVSQRGRPTHAPRRGINIG